MRVMISPGKRNVLLICVAAAVLLTAGLGVLSGAIPGAGAHTARRVKTQSLLTLGRGSYEISLGNSPSWLPLSNTPETLTLFAGGPTGAADDDAYVAFTRSSARCAGRPRGSTYEMSDFFSRSHQASRASSPFAPDGGASAHTYLDSVGPVRFNSGGSARVRACVWLASSMRRSGHSLVASLVLPVLNHTFAASVSNLTGASAGNGGYVMDAFDGGHPFSYSVGTLQCTRRSTDGSTSIAAGTPASETVSISESPCGGDTSLFSFRGIDTKNATLDYPVTDALANPPVTLSTGACELDPLSGVTVTAAESYLTAVGCKLGSVQVSPFVSALARGAVSWASVDGGVADIAPKGTSVDLVVNGAG